MLVINVEIVAKSLKKMESIQRKLIIMKKLKNIFNEKFCIILVTVI